MGSEVEEGMGPIEEHILLHQLHLEEHGLHLHLLLHLHKGLVEEHIQAQASGSEGNCVNHVNHLKGQTLRQIYCSLVYMKFSCVRINIKGLPPCPKGYSVPA